MLETRLMLVNKNAKRRTEYAIMRYLCFAITNGMKKSKSFPAPKRTESFSGPLVDSRLGGRVNSFTMDYKELLRDPRWQKKRLEIMQRDGFQCQLCYDDTSELHVHHCFYINGNEPWNYPDTSLITLCESCHDKETKDKSSNIKEAVNYLSMTGFTSLHIVLLSTMFLESNFDPYCPFDFSILGFALNERWPQLTSEYLASIKTDK